MQHHATLERTCVEERKSRDQETKYAVQLEQLGCARSALSWGQKTHVGMTIYLLCPTGRRPCKLLAQTLDSD
jgi:hypothetical protein